MDILPDGSWDSYYEKKQFRNDTHENITSRPTEGLAFAKNSSTWDGLDRDPANAIHARTRTERGASEDGNAAGEEFDWFNEAGRSRRHQQ